GQDPVVSDLGDRRIGTQKDIPQGLCAGTDLTDMADEGCSASGVEAGVTDPDGVDAHGTGQGDGAGKMEGLGDHGGGTDIEGGAHAESCVAGAVAVAVGLVSVGGDVVFDQVGVHGVRLVAGDRSVVSGDDDPVDASLLVQAHGQVQAAGQKGGGAVLPPCGAEDGGDGAMGCVLPVVAAAQARQPCPEQGGEHARDDPTQSDPSHHLL